MTNRVGQSTLEYLLVLVAILMVLLVAIGSGGIQATVGRVLSDSKTVIDNAVIQAKGRLGL